MAKKFYAPALRSGEMVSREVKKFYVPYLTNGQLLSKKVIKAYCSVVRNGEHVSRLFYEADNGSYETRVYKIRTQRCNYADTVSNLNIKEFIGDSSITKVTGKVLERSNAPQGEYIQFSNSGVEPLTPLTPYGTEVELPNYDYTKGIELRVGSTFYSSGTVSATVYAVIKLKFWR